MNFSTDHPDAAVEGDVVHAPHAAVAHRPMEPSAPAPDHV
jgi:hypothetical protein